MNSCLVVRTKCPRGRRGREIAEDAGSDSQSQGRRFDPFTAHAREPASLARSLCATDDRTFGNRIRRLRVEACTFQRIADLLNQDGVPTVSDSILMRSQPPTAPPDWWGPPEFGPVVFKRRSASRRQIAMRRKPMPMGPKGAGLTDAEDDAREDHAHDSERPAAGLAKRPRRGDEGDEPGHVPTTARTLISPVIQLSW